MRKPLAVLLTALAAFLLSGCFEMEEEIWLNHDGTARLRVVMGISESLIALMESYGDGADTFHLKDMSQQYTGDVAYSEAEEYSEGGYRYFAFTSEAVPLAQLSGDMLQVERLANGNVRFRQVFDFSDVTNTDGAADDTFSGITDMLFAAMMADRYITIILHAPRVVSTNGRLSDDGKTVTWQIPVLAIMADDGGVHEMEAEVSLAGTLPQQAFSFLRTNRTVAVPALAGAAVLLLAFAGFSFIQARRRQQAANMAEWQERRW